MHTYNTVLCGGTFDRLHKGHENFLKKASSIGRNVVLGITSDEYIKNNKDSSYIQNFITRKNAVESFLAENNIKNIEVTKTDDMYGPSLVASYDAILVTESTKKNAEKINSLRIEKNLPAIEIVVNSLVYAEDGNLISSSRIRNGEIDRNGKLYTKKEWLTKNLILPKQLRDEFKKPWGPLYKTTAEAITDISDKHLISVGDISTKNLYSLGITPEVSVVDFTVQREQKFFSLLDLGIGSSVKEYVITNKPGTISAESFTLIKKLTENPQQCVIKVVGEEDLLVLPFLLIYPLGYCIVYGQPHEGIVVVKVTEENKKMAYSLASEMQF